MDTHGAEALQELHLSRSRVYTGMEALSLVCLGMSSKKLSSMMDEWGAYPPRDSRRRLSGTCPPRDRQGGMPRGSDATQDTGFSGCLVHLFWLSGCHLPLFSPPLSGPSLGGRGRGCRHGRGEEQRRPGGVKERRWHPGSSDPDSRGSLYLAGSGKASDGSRERTRGGQRREKGGARGARRLVRTHSTRVSLT